MPSSCPSSVPCDEPAFQPGRTATPVGASWRANLGFGLCLVRPLAAAWVYLALVLGGPDGVEGGPTASHRAAP